MEKANIEILLSSDSDYEKLTAEIYYNGKFIALLNQDKGIKNLKIEFPSNNMREDTILRKIDLDVFEKALVLAKQKIKG